MGRILITGASGQLGRALDRLLLKKNCDEIYRTDAYSSEDGRVKALDITDEEAVSKLVNSIKPDIIINCAAMTAVDLCESEQDKAYKINALGPKYLAEAASEVGAKLVHISTDYVFDGQASEPYTESSEPNPVSVYGKTKLAGDKFVMEACRKYFILRTAWVYGEGKNFVKTMLRLAENGGKIRVVSDQYGTPTSALELARAVIFLMETDSYGIYNATCEGSTSWYEFALAIFKEAGKKAEVEPITSAEYPTPTKRPIYSILDNKALREKHGYYMKDWKAAFREFMSENGMSKA
jgi:dTDP-4-dehydrorhamnose reductase